MHPSHFRHALEGLDFRLLYVLDTHAEFEASHPTSPDVCYFLTATIASGQTVETGSTLEEIADVSSSLYASARAKRGGKWQVLGDSELLGEDGKLVPPFESNVVSLFAVA